MALSNDPTWPRNSDIIQFLHRIRPTTEEPDEFIINYRERAPTSLADDLKRIDKQFALKEEQLRQSIETYYGLIAQMEQLYKLFHQQLDLLIPPIQNDNDSGNTGSSGQRSRQGNALLQEWAAMLKERNYWRQLARLAVLETCPLDRVLS